MEIALFICSILVVQAATNNNNTDEEKDRIWGGKEVLIEEHPYQVSVHMLWNIFICGGSIITIKHVLTAGHCMQDRRPSLYYIKAGSNDLKTGGDNYDIQKIVIHPKYSKITLKYDSAVLMTKESIKMSNRVAIIPMAAPNEVIEEGSMAFVTGWGYKENHHISNTLLGVQVPIVGNSKCSRYNGLPILPEMICAGYEEGGKGPCIGDSGGPLAQKTEDYYKLIGIVSFAVGTECNFPKSPGVYTRVSTMRDWIREVTGT